MHCKPGFRPLTRNGVIEKCEKIENCSRDLRMNKWFNGCAKCTHGYSW